MFNQFIGRAQEPENFSSFQNKIDRTQLKKHLTEILLGRFLDIKMHLQHADDLHTLHLCLPVSNNPALV